MYAIRVAPGLKAKFLSCWKCNGLQFAEEMECENTSKMVCECRSSNRMVMGDGGV